MSVPASPALFATATCLLLGLASAQDPKPIAYPQRDILSPFRNPVDTCAPPDELFRQLRNMEAIAALPDAIKSFDKDGREVVDDKAWRGARAQVERLGIDASNLAQIIRLHKNAGDRATAFYAAFFVTNPDYVVNLISHIPGEPERRTREAAMPRAIEYLRVNLRRRFGDLAPEQKAELAKALPKVGSPEARAAGVVREPRDEDHLHDLLLTPFFQLLDLDDALDQAQGLWFLKEVFTLRADLALRWAEPALPRIRQLLTSDSPPVKEQAIGFFQAIGPAKLRPPPVDDPLALQQWVDEACKALFPPIRNLNDTIVQLHPSPERDAIAAAAVKALENSSIGDPVSGQSKDGKHYRGFRVILVPEELKPLAIPAESVITTVNGVLVNDAASLLKTVSDMLRTGRHPRRLFVEYVRNGVQHAVEYRVM
ncbi:MAG TPA: hypothetical protein VF384_06405 [Planctomycetota bacterium]